MLTKNAKILHRAKFCSLETKIGQLNRIMRLEKVLKKVVMLCLLLTHSTYLQGKLRLVGEKIGVKVEGGIAVKTCSCLQTWVYMFAFFLSF